MKKITLEIGRTYVSREGLLITIKRVLDNDDPLREKGYVFGGRSQGGVHEKHYTEFGKADPLDNSKHNDDLVRAILSEEDVVDSLWNVPGQSMEQLLKEVKSRDERLFIRHAMMDKLIFENRVSVLRYTTYAPSLKTTFFYFATEHGRLEIINNKPVDFAGFQIGHVHDPMGLWDTRMDDALKDG
jgi:hypothetical protein